MRHPKSKLKETAKMVLELMKETLSARSFFVASTKNERFVILDVINEEGGCTIPHPFHSSIEMSYCSMVVSSMKPLLIKDSSKSLLVKSMKVTSDFSIGSYLGVPITIEDGTAFGTLCALDPSPNALSEQDIPILQRYANLIANSIELEEAFDKLATYEEKTKKELDLAQRVQQSVMNKPLDTEEIKVDYVYKASAHLSGDLCAWYEIEKGKYGVILLDVMGHGVSSALIGMAIRPALESIIKEVGEPYAVMNQINRLILNLFDEESTFSSFVTGIYLVVNMPLQQVDFLNAGHPPGILKDECGAIFLERGTVPLGIQSTIPNQTRTVPFGKKGEIFLYTDGLLDMLYEENKNTVIEIKEKYEQLVNVNALGFFLEQAQASETISDDICMISILTK
ncbi:GAF domain-containing SpoIIE family protein phosphatase [Alkalihalobacterium bogoriense]|uniref:GAF domain-containing SpoIIE family protein phosphatase n=1 Tax=Alkalihalobacterium bogoriense TaxID=246272 RepID=UPI00047A2E34|nr:GAF domain-containing SpoIIE family protein phosphatase [Alkalihalobacterium bogoriense]